MKYYSIHQPLPSLIEFLSFSINGGHGDLCPIAMPLTQGVARICQGGGGGGLKQGSEATKRGRVVYARETF